MLNFRRLFLSALFHAFPMTAATPKQQRKHDRQVIGGKVQRASRYTPHQGVGERNRRAVQIARGIIATN